MSLVIDEGFTVEPLSPMRKLIAARMAEAKRTIPHFRLTATVEADALIAARMAANSRSPEDRVSLNDLIIKAAALALIDAPAVNVQWADTAIRRYQRADISVVTAIEGGLTTPIVFGADQLPVREIGRRVRALAERAARHALTLDEIYGGSFSISNLGMYGVEQFDAIINPPQCAMLAVGAALPRLIADAEGHVQPATLMRLTLSVDHRAIDGAVAAMFLQRLQAYLEQPAWAIEVAP